MVVPFVDGIHRAYVQTQVYLRKSHFTSPKLCVLGRVSFITVNLYFLTCKME